MVRHFQQLINNDYSSLFNQSCYVGFAEEREKLDSKKVTDIFGKEKRADREAQNR